MKSKIDSKLESEVDKILSAAGVGTEFKKPIAWKKPDYQLIVDENASQEAFDAFVEFAKERQIIYSDILYLRDDYQGITGAEIMEHLLHTATLFLTTDRVTHNSVIKKGLMSFYFSEGTINDRLLPKIVLKEKSEVVSKRRLHKTTYVTDNSVPDLVLPIGEKSMKSLASKRRRIRSYFEGSELSGEISLNISWLKFNNKFIFGYQMQAATKKDVPVVSISENYFVDAATDETAEYTAICYALVVLLRLNLQKITTVICFDIKQSKSIEFEGFAHLIAEDQKFFNLLKKQFTNIEFVGTDKSFNMIQIRKKLLQLKNTPNTNELIYENLTDIKTRVLSKSK